MKRYAQLLTLFVLLFTLLFPAQPTVAHSLSSPCTGFTDQAIKADCALFRAYLLEQAKYWRNATIPESTMRVTGVYITPDSARDAITPEDAIRVASAEWDDAFNAGDLARLLELYTEQAVDMPPNLPVLEGKAAIEADLQYVLEEFDAHHETSIIDIKVDGDLAVERAAYTMELTPKTGGDTMTEVGKHVVVRQQVGDEWKVLWEIWNQDESLP